MRARDPEQQVADRMELEDQIAKGGEAGSAEAGALLEGHSRADYLEGLIPYSGSPVSDARMVDLYRGEGFAVTEVKERGGYVTKILRTEQLKRIESVREVSRKRQMPRVPERDHTISGVNMNEFRVLPGMSANSFIEMPSGGRSDLGLDSATEY